MGYPMKHNYPTFTIQPRVVHTPGHNRAYEIIRLMPPRGELILALLLYSVPDNQYRLTSFSSRGTGFTSDELKNICHFIKLIPPQ